MRIENCLNRIIAAAENQIPDAVAEFDAALLKFGQRPVIGAFGIILKRIAEHGLCR